MSTIIRVQPQDVHGRLAELGLEEEPLRDVVRRGYLAYITCTANHPRMIPGIWAWGETVRALREYLLPLEWCRSEDSNYSVVIDPSGHMAIAVATGDQGTGRANATPTTNCPKGPCTVEAVVANQLQFGFMESQQPPTAPHTSDQHPDRFTWLLLIHRAKEEVRCELSLPASIGSGGHVDGWIERILLGAVPVDGDELDVVPPALPDITIDVKRRA
jgi:hypothetical protein